MMNLFAASYTCVVARVRAIFQPTTRMREPRILSLATNQLVIDPVAMSDIQTIQAITVFSAENSNYSEKVDGSDTRSSLKSIGYICAADRAGGSLRGGIPFVSRLSAL